MRKQSTLLVVLVGVAMAFVVGACGGDDASDSSTGGDGGAGGSGNLDGGDEEGGDVGGEAGDGGTGGGGTGGGGTGGGQTAGSVSEIHSCGSLGDAPSAGTCVVSVGSGATVYRGVVLGPDDVYEGGEVLVGADGVIECVGCDCSGEALYSAATKVVCPDGVISPGLINSHDHVTYGNNPPFGKGNPAVLKDVRYEHRHEWRRGLNGKPEIATNSGASEAVKVGVELRFMMSGATSINGSNGAKGVLRNVDKDDMNEGLGIPALTYQTFPLGDSGGKMLSSGCGYGSNMDTSSYAKGRAFYVPHVAEGINKAARNEFVCLSQGSNNLLMNTSAWIHGVGLVADDVKHFSTTGTKLIWSPRTNVSLYGDTNRMTLFHKAGAIIALGTDWMPSGSMSFVREFKCVRGLNENNFGGYFSEEDIWRMATTNGALATGTYHAIGMLKKTYFADIAIFNGKEHKRHSAVTNAELADTVLVLRSGRPMYGDSALMSELGKGHCEDMPKAADSGDNALWGTGVCGVAKKACISDDPSTSVTLSGVVSAITPIYPLYFCGTPTNEPSCVPMRPGQYGGIPTEGDQDGDGIPDSEDKCPTVFNPVRSLESGQGDIDGDGIGDECDVCPFDSDNTNCEYNLDPNDVDGDGIGNGSDNCPYDYNPDQADQDGDGIGDVCDKCPTIPNARGAKCPVASTTIANARQTMGTGAEVRFAEAVVTGVRKLVGASNGFYIADESQPLWGCIFVHTQSTLPTVVVGDRLDISGTMSVYNGVVQLTTGHTIASRVSGAALVPMVATVADLAGSNHMAYQSCRLEVSGVSIVANGSDVQVSQGSSKVQLSNFIWEGGAFPAAGQSYTSIRGYLGENKSVTEFLPQRLADLTP